MQTSQKIVAIGALSGVIIMVISVSVLFYILPDVSDVNSLPERLAFALTLNVFALVPLFVMLIAVGNGRFLSDAIDPTKHLETKSIEINGRVADNTFQQNFVFFVGTMALSTLLNGHSIKLLVALVIVFIISRTVFWIGYRINPLYRAPGMSSTAYMNLGIIIYTMYAFIT